VATVFFGDNRESAAFERTIVAPLSKYRISTHRLVDKVMGALTGYDGPFVSRLVFVRTLGKERTVFTIDPDGHGAKGLSPKDHLAVGPAIGPNDEIYYAASVNHGSYRVFRMGDKTPLTLDPPGSVYGLAFSADRKKVAVSIAVGTAVQLFTGASDFTGLRLASKLPLALHPTFSPSGDLAFAGAKKVRQRVYARGKAVSIPGPSASAPDYCRHPDGTKIVYTVGFRRTADVIVAEPRGGEATRITRGSGRNSYPACSPDGRVIAFFSTRASGDGPGLYVMRVDGHHVRKISSMMGDSLRWARIDPDRAR
jgi:TolB protein